MIQINLRISQIITDPRNKLESLKDKFPKSDQRSHRPSIGANNPDKHLGSRELDTLKERAFGGAGRQAGRRMSFTLSFRNVEAEKEYEWEIKWKEIILEEKVGEGR